MTPYEVTNPQKLEFLGQRLVTANFPGTDIPSPGTSNTFNLETQGNLAGYTHLELVPLAANQNLLWSVGPLDLSGTLPPGMVFLSAGPNSSPAGTGPVKVDASSKILRIDSNPLGGAPTANQPAGVLVRAYLAR